MVVKRQLTRKQDQPISMKKIIPKVPSVGQKLETFSILFHRVSQVHGGISRGFSMDIRSASVALVNKSGPNLTSLHMKVERKEISRCFPWWTLAPSLRVHTKRECYPSPNRGFPNIKTNRNHSNSYHEIRNYKSTLSMHCKQEKTN